MKFISIVLMFGELSLEVDKVSQWAKLVDEFGAVLILGIVLGLAFLFAASIMFKRTLSSSERSDTRREEREDAIDAERRAMTDKVIDLAGSSTKAVEASTEAIRATTKEIVEFRRDTYSAFSRIEEAFSKQTALILDKSDESAESLERLRLQNEEIGLRVARLEGVKAVQIKAVKNKPE